MIDQLFPKCPVCKGKISEPIDFCKRCGCDLLLLSKIKIEGAKLFSEGKITQAKALYAHQETEQWKF